MALAERIGKLRLALRPMFASATKGQGVVAHDILREVKVGHLLKPADSASRSLASTDYSGEPPSGPSSQATQVRQTQQQAGRGCF